RDEIRESERVDYELRLGRQSRAGGRIGPGCVGGIGRDPSGISVRPRIGVGGPKQVDPVKLRAGGRWRRGALSQRHLLDELIADLTIDAETKRGTAKPRLQRRHGRWTDTSGIVGHGVVAN